MEQETIKSNEVSADLKKRIKEWQIEQIIELGIKLEDEEETQQ